jgi:catechol 2,3-dioxygenase-like lactoylglutathione lyase family enzyme
MARTAPLKGESAMGEMTEVTRGGEKKEPAKAGQKEMFVRGVHHLVLTTDDLKTSIDFYMDIFGMRLLHGIKVAPGLGTGPLNRGNPPFENIRHYFMDMGNDSILAFFEIPKGAKPRADRDAIGGMQHVSFCIKPESEYKALLERLKARGIEYIGPRKMGSGPGYSTYFYDPHGVRLEVSCDTTKEEPAIVKDATSKKSELLKELRTLCDDEAWLEKVTAHLSD